MILVTGATGISGAPLVLDLLARVNELSAGVKDGTFDRVTTTTVKDVGGKAPITLEQSVREQAGALR